MNAQFLRFDPLGSFKPERVLKDKSGKQTYKFYYQILSGFELGSKLPEEHLETYVDLKIGNLPNDKCKTEPKSGRFP